MGSVISGHQRVVVRLKVRAYRNKARKMIAVRAWQLGLTGYGRSREEADKSLEQLFQRFVSELRKRNQLEERLNLSGVPWHWEGAPSSEWELAEDTDGEVALAA